MIKPLGQRIIVKRLSEKERGGIVIPTQAQKTSLVGEVLATGPDADWVVPGDIVHFARFSGTEVKMDGTYAGSEYEDCLYMNCEDLLGVIKSAAKEAVPV
jgi:chaperonin GroES